MRNPLSKVDSKLREGKKEQRRLKRGGSEKEIVSRLWHSGPQLSVVSRSTRQALVETAAVCSAQMKPWQLIYAELVLLPVIRASSYARLWAYKTRKSAHGFFLAGMTSPHSNNATCQNGPDATFDLHLLFLIKYAEHLSLFSVVRDSRGWRIPNVSGRRPLSIKWTH